MRVVVLPGVENRRDHQGADPAASRAPDPGLPGVGPGSLTAAGAGVLRTPSDSSLVITSTPSRAKAGEREDPGDPALGPGVGRAQSPGAPVGALLVVRVVAQVGRDVAERPRRRHVLQVRPQRRQRPDVRPAVRRAAGDGPEVDEGVVPGGVLGPRSSPAARGRARRAGGADTGASCPPCSRASRDRPCSAGRPAWRPSSGRRSRCRRPGPARRPAGSRGTRCTSGSRAGSHSPGPARRSGPGSCRGCDVPCRGTGTAARPWRATSWRGRARRSCGPHRVVKPLFSMLITNTCPTRGRAARSDDAGDGAVGRLTGVSGHDERQHQSHEHQGDADDGQRRRARTAALS